MKDKALKVTGLTSLVALVSLTLFGLCGCDSPVGVAPPDVTVEIDYEIISDGGDLVWVGVIPPDDGDVEDEDRKEEEDVPVDPLVVPQLSILKYFDDAFGYKCCVGAVQIPYTDEWKVIRGYPLRELQALKVTLLNNDGRKHELREVEIVNNEDFASNVKKGWSKSWDNGFEEGPYLDILYKEDGATWQQIKHEIEAGWQTILITD